MFTTFRATAIAALVAVLCLSSTSRGITVTEGSPTIVYDFQSFAGTGFSPSPSADQLDSNDIIVTGLSDGDLAFGDTGTTGDYARGARTTAATSGGVYAFTVDSDVLLGVQPSADDFTVGTFVFKFTNSGSSTITSITLGSELYVRNDQGRASTFDAYLSTDDETITTSDTLIDDFTSIEASGLPDFVLQPGEASGVVNGLSIAPGTDFYIGYLSDDATGSGSRDEFGLGSVTLTATFGGGPTNLSGDFNGDGTVDAADYTFWRDNEGKDASVLPTGTGGADSLVNADDYTIWRNNFGVTNAPLTLGDSGAVPEPTTLVTGLLALSLGLGLRKRMA